MPRTLLSAALSLSVLFSTLAAAQNASYTFTPIDVPGAMLTVASGINDNGQIVGHFTDATGTHGFLKDGTTFTPIDVRRATQTFAHGINDNGQIVGHFTDATGTHGFLKDGATFTIIDVPDATQTFAYGINTAGQIVGYFSNAAGGTQGFLATPRRPMPPHR
jgi:probable HAF family extracellular repeat protein